MKEIARAFCVVGVLALLGILLLAPASPAQSQISTGTIRGTVFDKTGAVVPGAEVVIKHVATGVKRTLTTDQEGRFTAPLLEVGDYEITISAPGFGTTISKGYALVPPTTAMFFSAVSL